MNADDLVSWVGGLIDSVENARAVGPHDMDEDKANLKVLAAKLADAERWRKLVADTDAVPCEWPCLRDDLADWIRSTPATGEKS